MHAPRYDMTPAMTDPEHLVPQANNLVDGKLSSIEAAMLEPTDMIRMEMPLSITELVNTACRVTKANQDPPDSNVESAFNASKFKYII